MSINAVVGSEFVINVGGDPSFAIPSSDSMRHGVDGLGERTTL